ncbi:MAG TPA: hypothetical protein VH720_08670, partial [Candidatus Limnocylindrales bacterium]
MTAAVTSRREPRLDKPIRWSRIGLHAFLIVMCAIWLFPLAWAAYTSLRPYGDTQVRGYVSLPGTLNLQNYVDAWDQAELPHFYLNTLVV